MSDEETYQPDPTLIEEINKIVDYSDGFQYSSIKDLLKYFKGKPTSEDAVKVGDLIIRINDNIFEQIENSNLSEEDLEDAREDYACRCSTHMMRVTCWYDLAIQLDPNNKKAYERLAGRVWWGLNEWPGTTLEPLLTQYDDKTFQKVKEQYLKELSDWANSLG
ncbi:MAG: hypothetical protein KGH55_01975 [Nanoarchaeota archaeon]|nr:hypothetical protein [Nanoarchaeota archaeon]